MAFTRMTPNFEMVCITENRDKKETRSSRDDGLSGNPVD